MKVKIQKKAESCDSAFSAEREGFEPPDPCESTVFKTAAFDHSAISLCWSLPYCDTKVRRFFLNVNSRLSFFEIFLIFFSYKTLYY